MKHLSRMAAVMLGVGLVSWLLIATSAQAGGGFPPSYWTQRSMKVPVAACVSAANAAVKKAGLTSVTKSADATGGVTATTRGYVVCVRLPHAGDCNGDGATAVFVTAGADAKSLLDKMVDKFKAPVTIDCGSVGNPVDE